MGSLAAALAAATSVEAVTAVLRAELQQRIRNADVEFTRCGALTVALPKMHDVVSRPLVACGRPLGVLRIAAPALTGADVEHIDGLVPLVALAIAAALLVSGPVETSAATADVEARVTRAAATWRLTPRQRDVLFESAQGLSNKDIALALGCSPRTVEAHMCQVLAKAGADSRGAVVAMLWGEPMDSEPSADSLASGS